MHLRHLPRVFARYVRDREVISLPEAITGIQHVLVNDRLALENGAQNDTLSGRMLRRAD